MSLVRAARRLRLRDTAAARALWLRLRDRRLDGVKFKRQVEIEGKIVDFASWDARLVVEVDGGQHADQSREDEERTRILEAAGFHVLRFWNNEVLVNMDGVLAVILDHVVAARRRNTG